MRYTSFAPKALTNNTVRIVSILNNGDTASGTGFFFKAFDVGNAGFLPLIITNKHVIKDAVEGEIFFNAADSSGNLAFGKHFLFQFDDFENLWIGHPDDSVDLCCFPIGDLPSQVRNLGEVLSYCLLDETAIPQPQEWAEINALEDVIMIGYPNGIWDYANNMPIVRKGIAATHPYLNFQNREEFVIDMACFPGSSGSPVFLYNPSGYLKETGEYIFTQRFRLLGILYAGPQHTAEGDVRIVTIPTQQKAIAISGIPNNLGYVIKATKILDFIPILQSRIEINSI